MGLIKAAAGAIGSTLGDQWKEAIRCEDLGNDILMKKVTTKNGVISNGSIVVIGPGQCAIIYDNGKVIDASAEEGTYTFDTSSTPSFFAGQFGAVFKEMWQRFTFNGATAKQQAVFFFNTKEIIKNKYGTPNPVPFQDWSHPIPNEMTGQYTPLRVQVKCFGNYTFRIFDPATFMNVISGTADVYRKDELLEQMRSEVLDSFQNLLNELGNSKNRIPVLELPSQTDEIKEMMNERVFDEPIRKRGIAITGFTVESVTLDDESNKKIDNYELSANSRMQQGKLVGSYADAAVAAANNAKGAANGFMGLGMMNMASGGIMGGAALSPFQNAAPAKQVQDPVPEPEYRKPAETTAPAEAEPEAIVANEPAAESETKTVASKKFCSECGTKLEPGAKFCPECGTKVQ